MFIVASIVHFPAIAIVVLEVTCHIAQEARERKRQERSLKKRTEKGQHYHPQTVVQNSELQRGARIRQHPIEKENIAMNYDNTLL